jgi:hypothetical protein
MEWDGDLARSLAGEEGRRMMKKAKDWTWVERGRFAGLCGSN